jgi:hypothetical protein
VAEEAATPLATSQSCSDVGSLPAGPSSDYCPKINRALPAQILKPWLLNNAVGDACGSDTPHCLEGEAADHCRVWRAFPAD